MKQLRITITGRENLVINLNENELINVIFQNNATLFLKHGEPQATIAISGNRWQEDDFFSFDWGQYELALGDKILLQIIKDSEIPSPVRKEEKYVEPEKTCTFCDRPASQVKHLIEGNIFACICDDCIEECQRLLWRQ